MRERLERLLLAGVDPVVLARAINNATPEQIAEAMTRCTPEAEEWGRRFEDANTKR